MYDYDMVVIGSGPSGRRAAVQFAKLECRPRESRDPYAVSLTLKTVLND